MTPRERAYKIVCDTFGAESRWEHVTGWIEDEITFAVAAETERCATLSETLLSERVRGCAFDCDCFDCICDAHGKEIAARIRGDE